MLPVIASILRLVSGVYIQFMATSQPVRSRYTVVLQCDAVRILSGEPPECLRRSAGKQTVVLLRSIHHADANIFQFIRYRVPEWMDKERQFAPILFNIVNEQFFLITQLATEDQVRVKHKAMVTKCFRSESIAALLTDSPNFSLAG